jgi:ABC-type branched-subunit amino acid transport system substrate-binding protein
MRSSNIAVAALLVAVCIAVLAMPAGAARSAAAPVKIFVIAPVATPIQNYPDAQAGAEAAAQAINKAGGIKGRQIEIGFCNTQSNPNQAVSCARQAVEANAVAVVGHVDTFSNLSIPVLQQAGIPDVGMYSSGIPIDWTNPDVFPMAGGAPGAFQALPFAFKKLGKKRLVIPYQDQPSAYFNAKLVKNAAKAAGMPIVGTFLIPGATTDFSVFATKIRELNADSVIFVTSSGLAGGLMRAAHALGVRPLWSVQSGTFGESDIQQVGDPAEGMMVAAPFPPYRATQYPGIRRFNAEMTAAGKNEPLQRKPVAVDTWLSVYAIATLGKRMKGQLTNTTLMAALKAQKKPMNLFGLYDFVPGKPGPAAFPRWSNIVVFIEKAKNGTLVAWGPPFSKPIYPMVAQKYVR